ncbi:putative osbpl1a, partial [Operophtera brumata]
SAAFKEHLLKLNATSTSIALKSTTHDRLSLIVKRIYNLVMLEEYNCAFCRQFSQEVQDSAGDMDTTLVGRWETGCGSSLGGRHPCAGCQAMLDVYHGGGEGTYTASHEEYAWRDCFGKSTYVLASRRPRRELAVQFAELGATVICWDNDARRNNTVVEEIRKKDGELSEVSMVISNAGAMTCAPISHIRPEAIAKLIEINLMAHFWVRSLYYETVIQAFLPSMIERRHGHIVAINSSAGLMPCADMIPYCAAKFGLKELRLDTWTKNINITSVYLGTVSTGLYPSPTHRFTSWYSEITAKDAARIMIEVSTGLYPSPTHHLTSWYSEVTTKDAARIMIEGCSSDSPGLEAQESLLYSARHGELSVVKALLEAKNEGKLTLDLNCKGKSKSNLGWTPLQLATYFGHVDVVKALLEAGADVDETRDVQRLLEAAQRSERNERERRLLTAAKEGRVEDIQELLSSPHPPNINCVDSQGNTCLHCAAYRGHARLAVLLLQNGVDTTLKNNSGQLAVDIARDADMREVLSVRPVHQLQRTAARFEGPLLKRSRFLGWRRLWVSACMLLHRARRGHARGAERAAGAPAAAHRGALRGAAAEALAFPRLAPPLACCYIVRDADMREVLSVRPVHQLQRTAARFAGPLLKRSRFFGWRRLWVSACMLLHRARRGHARGAERAGGASAAAHRGALRGAAAEAVALFRLAPPLDADMREVLSVRPVHQLQRTAARFEGPLLKRSRFLGWRRLWAVLQRGVLLYYGSRAEAARGDARWRSRKYLDGASVVASDSAPASLLVSFSDGDSQRLAVPPESDPGRCRQYLDGASDSAPASLLVSFSDGDSQRLAVPPESDPGRCRQVRQGHKYLDGASDSAPASLLVSFSDGDSQRLAVPPESDPGRCRQYLDGASDSAPASLLVSFSDGDSQRLAVPPESDPGRCRQVRQGHKYLDGASDSAPASLLVSFSEGDSQRLAVPPESDPGRCRQAWITAFNDHIAYSGHYLWAGASPDSAKEATEELDDDCKPLGSMQDALTAASNHMALLETQLRECSAILTALHSSTATAGSSTRAAPAKKLCRRCGTAPRLSRRRGTLTPRGSTERLVYITHYCNKKLCRRCGTAPRSSRRRGTLTPRGSTERLVYITHYCNKKLCRRCGTAPRSSRRRGTLTPRGSTERLIERNRVLEEALAALARTHHALEMSVAEELTKSKRKKKSKSSSTLNDSKENFFDVFEESEDEDDTLVTAGLSSPLGALSPWGSSPDLTRRTPIGSVDGDVTPTNEERDGYPRRLSAASGSSGSNQSLHTAVSPASSRGTLVSQGGHVYRNARPYRKQARPSSEWSV